MTRENGGFRRAGYGVATTLSAALALIGCSGKGEDDTRFTDQEWGEERVSAEAEVLRLVNEHRAAGTNCAGQAFDEAPALEMDEALQLAARKHSQDMVDRNYFSHEGKNGSSFSDRAEDAGFDGFAMGENIAAGQSTAEAVVDTWMNSEGHCKNIMNPDVELLGVGYTTGGEWGHMWTQVFGRL